MTITVVDASVAVKWLLPETSEDAANRILIKARRIMAPAIIRIEVTGAILRQFRENRMSDQAARLACAQWQQILREHIHLIANDDLFDLAVNLAFKTRHALPDCFYLAAAYSMKGELVTADATLLRRGQAVHSRVRLLKTEESDGD
jgi:predicted nucleic acid-binding protein